MLNNELSGTLSSNDLRPSLLSEHKYVPGLLRFDARGQVRFIAGHLPEGQVLLAVRDATIENHQFRDIKVDLTHKNGLADLKLDSHQCRCRFHRTTYRVDLPLKGAHLCRLTI